MTAINLGAPLSWRNAEGCSLEMLKNLQGNILKGHGRSHVACVFIGFGDPRQARHLLRTLAERFVTSALSQLRSSDARRKGCATDGDFCHIALSLSGYEAINCQAPAGLDYMGRLRVGPDYAEHAAGTTEINDVPSEWEQAFRDPDNPIHALILAAAPDACSRGSLTRRLIDLVHDNGARVLHIQHGQQLRNRRGSAIEHFGYADSISQPLMLQEDIDALAGDYRRTLWEPAAPLNTVLVQDPWAPERVRSTCFGSYLVFRKLEQNVRSFKEREFELADNLGLHGDDRERAGALVMGRFKDGTPVTLSSRAWSDRHDADKINDFDYEQDYAGTRCPRHAHIRKMNPRDGRMDRLVRRGIPYEDKMRLLPPDETPLAGNTRDFQRRVAPLLPERDVGLLFMAYNSSLETQFRRFQHEWGNDPFKPRGQPGIDPIIGSLDPDMIRAPVNRLARNTSYPGMPQDIFLQWNSNAAVALNCEFSGHVTMKGGEYFFSPSLPFLTDLIE